MLSRDQALEIGLPFSDQEIYNTLIDIVEDKSPSIEGFTAKFYTSYWDIIGKHFTYAIIFFSSSFKLLDLFKNTLLTFIPKSKNVSRLEDFHPISLCNMFYKTITKLLANRLKKVVPHLIHPTQTAFIQGRDISNNITLEHELCGDLFSGHRSKVFCAKIDLKKAFDSVNTSFLLLRLRQKGFPDTFIKWIEACVCKIPVLIIINGAFSKYFYSSNGLRQGCPLSPFLFTLMTDLLSCLLEKKIREKKFFTLKSEHNLTISHLLFADDVLIFGEANHHSACALKRSFEDLFY